MAGRPRPLTASLLADPAAGARTLAALLVAHGDWAAVAAELGISRMQVHRLRRRLLLARGPVPASLARARSA